MKKTKGIIFMLLAVTSFSVMQLVVSMTDRNISVYEQVFFRNLFGVFVAGYYIVKNNISPLGNKKYQPFLLARSGIGYIGLVFLFYASRNANLGDATILSRTCPIFITIFSAMFLKEKISKIQVPALIIIFIGGWIVAQPKFDSSFLPLFSALLSALCSGICYTLLAYFKGKVHGMTVIFHFSLFSVLASIPIMANNFVLPTGKNLVMILLIGLLGSSGQIFLTYAYRMAPAAEISIYDQLSIVISIVLGSIFLGQTPKANSLFGGLLIILSSLTVFYYNNYYIPSKRKQNVE